ncbi:hypothetical protein VPH35_059750 [Triticum aestivum]
MSTMVASNARCLLAFGRPHTAASCRRPTSRSTLFAVGSLHHVATSLLPDETSYASLSSWLPVKACSFSSGIDFTFILLCHGWIFSPLAYVLSILYSRRLASCVCVVGGLTCALYWHCKRAVAGRGRAVGYLQRRIRIV